MGAPPAPVVRRGAGMGLIAGLILGALVLSAGGYFGYKKFFGPKEPGQETAQSQTPAGQAQPPAAMPEQPPANTAQSQPQSDAGSGQGAAAQGYAAQPPSRTTVPVPAQGAGAKMPPRAQQTQTPVYTPAPTEKSAPAYTPPSQPSAPAYTPPTPNEPVSRPPSQQAAPPQQRSFPPAPVTQTPPQASAPTGSTAARYSGPASGMLMWMGKLDKNGLVTIDGNRASAGTLTGALPGVPVTLETDLTNIGFAEMPGPSNGWKRVALRSRKSQNIVISIRWKVLN